MDIDPDGTFEVTTFPASAVGHFPRSIDWGTASNSGNELLIHAMKARTEYFDLLP